MAVAVGVGLTGLVFAPLGFAAAVAAGTGALCVSISDRPDPLRQRLWVLGLALVAACLFTALSSFTQFSLPAFILATAFSGFFGGLVSAYGRWALSLAMTSVLAFVFAMGQHFHNLSDAMDHLMVFVCGALVYTTYAVVTGWALDDRTRRLLLAEAMRAFSDFLRAKAALYNPDAEGPAAFRAMIDAHTALADRLQAARDSVFERRRGALALKRIDTLLALVDAFETALSSDADLDLLRRAPQRELMWQMNAFAYGLADEVDRLTLALRSRYAAPRLLSRDEQTAQLEAELAVVQEAAPRDRIVLALVSTVHKLVLAQSYIVAVARTLDSATPPTGLAASLDLRPFQQSTPRGLSVLWRQVRDRSPALRYAVRLALAMTAGLALTMAFPRFAHANWVLLTIALIMRANYSVTSRRRWDRVTGTLIGCALAVGLILLLPAPGLLFALILALGTSHAYATVKYRITAIGASISSLLLLHFVDPLSHPQFFERIVDTLIGAALSWAFGYLLPHWERNDLPRTVKNLLAADAVFADAALIRVHIRQNYRLARKAALDAVAQLSGTIGRLADEPHINRRALAALAELLGANYLLASDLSSMPVLVKLRDKELDPQAADAAIAAARERVRHLLTADPVGEENSAPESQPVLHGNVAMEVLARRLAHIEHAARKVAKLAARSVIEDI
ncbi:MAG TPA: FUSC family membrane protein [Rhizomicrobium sp.]|nr:FUSC family membrane protein [Rhizomicrobium sp.]